MAELVAVIVLIGILSVFAASRMWGNFASARAFHDQLLSQVQFARKVAIAQRRPVFVRIDGAQARLCYSAAGACAGGDAVASPSGEAPFRVAVPTGITVTAATFQFDALGRYRDAAGAATAVPLVLSVVGEGTLAFSVEHETGYVRP